MWLSSHEAFWEITQNGVLSCSGVRLCLLRLAMALNIRIDEDFTFNVYEDINEDNFFNTNCLIKTETCPEETFE